MSDEPVATAALCQERPFATWRAAMRQPGATDYRLCAQHGAWHAVTATTTAAACGHTAHRVNDRGGQGQIARTAWEPCDLAGVTTLLARTVRRD